MKGKTRWKWHYVKSKTNNYLIFISSISSYGIIPFVRHSIKRRQRNNFLIAKINCFPSLPGWKVSSEPSAMDPETIPNMLYVFLGLLYHFATVSIVNPRTSLYLKLNFPITLLYIFECSSIAEQCLAHSTTGTDHMAERTQRCKTSKRTHVGAPIWDS